MAKILLLFFCYRLMSGQIQWRGEAEFTQDNKGHQTYDVYVFGTTNQLAFFGRYLRSENSIHRGEFGMGHALRFFNSNDKRARMVVVPYSGITTDKALLLVAVNLVSVAGRTIAYIPDAKFYSGRKTLYQEVSVGLTKRGGWQFRWEMLDLWQLPIQGNTIPHLRAFNRLGIERRIWAGNSSHFHISPFYDWANRGAGFYTGFRW